MKPTIFALALTFLIPVTVPAARLSHDLISCGLYANGRAEGEGFIIGKDGTCFRTNGYHSADYTLKVVHENDKTIYQCSNKYQHSWYPRWSRLTIHDSGEALLEDMTPQGWKAAAPELRCELAPDLFN